MTAETPQNFEVNSLFPLVPAELSVPEISPISTPNIAVNVPAEMPMEESLRDRSGNVGRAVVADLKEANNIGTISAGIGMVALQVADRMRTSVVLVPKVALDVYMATHSPTQTALAAGATFGGWCLGVGGFTTEGLYKFPRTLEAANDNFPKLVEGFEGVLPGFDIGQEKQADIPLARRAGQRLLTLLKRGGTVSGVGTTMYVGTAAAKGAEKKTTHRLNIKASADGGVIIGGFIFGVAEAINQVAHSNPELALRIQHDASNIKLWYGVAGFLMLQQFVANKLKRRGSDESVPSEQPLNIAGQSEVGMAAETGEIQ